MPPKSANLEDEEFKELDNNNNKISKSKCKDQQLIAGKGPCNYAIRDKDPDSLSKRDLD